MTIKKRRAGKIDKMQMIAMLQDGKGVTEIARHFGVRPTSISQYKSEFKLDAAELPPVDTDLVGGDVNYLHQLASLQEVIVREFGRCNTLLASKEMTDETATQIMEIHNNLVKLSAEVRKHTELRVKIAETLYNMQYVQEFQADVLDAIKSVSQDVAARIVRAIKERRMLRGLVGIK